MNLKKYSNRRLYDSEASRYITLEEAAERVRLGESIQVTDAKTGRDLTQVTLAQLILESRGAARLLPIPLLVQLLRMRDDALAEFFGRYVTWALDVYLRLRQGARSVWGPLADIGFAAPERLARLLRPSDGPGPAPVLDDPPPDPHEELAALRRELEELRRTISHADGPSRQRVTADVAD